MRRELREKRSVEVSLATISRSLHAANYSRKTVWLIDPAFLSAKSSHIRSPKLQESVIVERYPHMSRKYVHMSRMNLSSLTNHPLTNAQAIETEHGLLSVVESLKRFTFIVETGEFLDCILFSCHSNCARKIFDPSGTLSGGWRFPCGHCKRFIQYGEFRQLYSQLAG